MRLLSIVGLLGVIGASLAAYATNTNNLYNSLNTCVNDLGDDISCVETVRDGLQQMSDYIQDIRDLKENMQSLNNGLNTFNSVLSIARYAPGIGTAVTVLQRSLSVIRPTFNSAYSRVQTVDSRTYPFKSRCDTGVDYCDTAIDYMTIMQDKCTGGRNGLGTARTCVNSMVSSTLKTTLGNNLEDLGGALYPSFNTANEALGVVGSGCDAVRSYAEIVLGWPDISFIIDGINDVYGALEPILDFFEHLQNALNTELCIPDPFEAIAEWELIEEAGEALNPTNWGWGRRRRAIPAALRSSAFSAQASIGKRAQISITREQAHSLLAVTKRGSLCLSAQDILDGVDALLAPLVDLANDLISAVLSALPSFSIPGFPNFNNLFNIDINFDLPTIEFGFDLNDYVDFIWLNWNCATQVGNACNAVSGGVSVSCGASLSSYYPSFSGWGWGRKRRSLGQDVATSVRMIEMLEEMGHKKEKRTRPHKKMFDVTPTPAPAEPTDKPSTLVIDLEILHDDAPRKDDKQLTAEKAEEIVEHMTEKQRERLRERLNNGGPKRTTPALATTAATVAATAAPSLARREMMIELLNKLKTHGR